MPRPIFSNLALPVRSDATMAVAWGDVAPWLPDWIQIVEASGPAGRAAGKDLGTLLGESIDGGSCSADLGVVPMTTLCSLTVRPGVDAARALESLRGVSPVIQRVVGRRGRWSQAKAAQAEAHGQDRGDGKKPSRQKDPQFVAVMNRF